MISYKYVAFLGMLTFFVLSRNTTADSDYGCGENEEYVSCYSTCPSESCDDLMLREKCRVIPPDECEGGCRCKTNYRRDESGQCVSIYECPPMDCKNDNEVFDFCPNPCDTDYCYVSIVCTDRERNKPYTCFPRCVCDKGYCRSSETHTCRANVTNTCTGINEVWSECGNNGCQKTCDDYYKWSEGRCDDTCKSGCICAPGYYRNRLGVCVVPDKCGEGVCKKFEEYLFCRPCPRGMLCAAIVCRGPSVCECIKGYVRDARGNCYKPVPQKCLKKNEVFDICPPPDRTCSQVFNGTYPSQFVELCKPGCACSEGYVRKDTGECVLPENCCTDPNAKAVKCPYRCGGGTCANPNIDESCKRACAEPAPIGCQCNKGYTRLNEKSSKCIPVSTCPKKY